MKPAIVLYNPAAPYYTLPLQYLALASVVDRDRYDVVIVDARIERSVRRAHAMVRELLPRAVCIGVSVITGTPIKDAVALSRMVRREAPGVPVIWGGWHPSIYPEQCLREGFADYCVAGQGELTFAALIDALEAGGGGLDRIEGLARLAPGGEFVRNPDRKFTDINRFPGYDYGLLPLERYFALKGERQIDFYSSQGCPYRCAFCADPTVYGRRWSGLKGPRMLFDVFEAAERYRVDDVLFQDENFFANRNRVLEFCRGVNERGRRFTWAATSRADQIAPLDDSFLAELARARCRKVMIGAESGSQEMLDLMKKDTLAEEALVSAEKLARHGIGAAFGFIVGFPEEEFSQTLATLKTITEIKRINPAFEFNIFFFTPYPGTELFRYIVDRGYRVPQSLEGWSDIDFILYAGYWVKPRERRFVERFKFYTKIATERPPAGGAIWRPIRSIAAARVRNDWYTLPVEKELLTFVRRKILRHVAW